jgi:hypothetical protein
MILSKTRTLEWIMGIREQLRGKDPILIEKMIMSMTLVEDLKLSGLDFIFKGGTSLLLLLGTPRRFSIDIDVLVAKKIDPEKVFPAIVDNGSFVRYEENRRQGELPKQHYKFFFNSVIEAKESHILLDILADRNPYPRLQEVRIESPLLSTGQKVVRATCPTVEGLLGDKLTAFAPHTTGILYGTDKELDIAKQLFDIGTLFDVINDLPQVRKTFEHVANAQLTYRKLVGKTPIDVLHDAFETSCLIGRRGGAAAEEYAELVEGFKKLAAFVYSGFFSLDTAILCAAKLAYLVALIMVEDSNIDRFKGQDIASWMVTNPTYSKLNKVKKTSPESFYYFYRALEIRNLLGEQA